VRPARDDRLPFTSAEVRRLGWLGGAVVLLHVAGWGLFAWYARAYPALAGLGTLAYTFGLRHAFDVDHIAAIDNTARKLLQSGRRSQGVGFFFSLGHASVVLGVTAGLALGARTVAADLPTLRSYGGVVGASVSGVFLLLVGLLNLFVLLDVLGVFRALRRGRYDEEALERRLLDQGLLSRLFLRRLGDRIDRSWKMYPLGLLFGLGFDTATEVALLALAAGVATDEVPFLAVISLPLLFAAGMSLMDTLDGVFMSHAYGWAFASPVRKVYYNLTVTSLSVLLALSVGAVELVQAAAAQLSHGSAALPGSGRAGYVVAGVFLLAWLVSAAVWRLRRIEERWSALL
jgi:nickel/cobalt transporter (NiCoT) family protein